MLDKDRQQQLDRLLDGNLSEEESMAVQASIEDDPEAIDWLADRALLHAQLRRSMQRRGLEAEAREEVPYRVHTAPRRSMVQWALVAAVILLLGMNFLPRKTTDKTFVTLEQTQAAFWYSGELPTAAGSRLGQGTLRLAEGLATLQFDSGAKVVLEAPATLVLMDAMNCELTQGTAVSDIPESAQGFRIKTPSADVVDYGTRFAVSVFADTGETHTQVMEGHVEVEHAATGKVIELKTGQENTVSGEVVGKVGARDGFQTRSIAPVDYGPDWAVLEPVKDAYTGHARGHESDVLLYVKTGVWTNSPHRKAYVGFDLEGVDLEQIGDAKLDLYFSPTGWGLASFVPAATFSVYGLVGPHADWNEDLLRKSFPGDPEQIHLGSFTVPQGVERGRFGIQTEPLVTFLRELPNKQVTLLVVRDTKELEDGGLVHGFASRRHPTLPPPRLSIRAVTP
jgi:hypothetical protein